MGGALGIVVLDQTVVGVALPTIRNDLGMTQITSHWVINAYLLVFTTFAAAGGKLGDIYSLKKVFLCGLAIFGLSSLAAGLSGSGAAIIAARLAQGIGAALIFPGAVSMISRVFPPEQRGLAYGVQTASGGVFMALGPLTGGFFTEVVTWRWVFWINLPVTAAIMVIVLAAWGAVERKGRRARLDYPGLALLVTGLGALTLGIMQGAEWGYGSPAIIASLAGGAVLLVVFVAVETRVSEPLIEVALFRNVTFTGSNLVILPVKPTTWGSWFSRPCIYKALCV